MFIARQQLSFVLGIICEGILCPSRGAYQCDMDKACAAPLRAKRYRLTFVPSFWTSSKTWKFVQGFSWLCQKPKFKCTARNSWPQHTLKVTSILLFSEHPLSKSTFNTWTFQVHHTMNPSKRKKKIHLLSAVYLQFQKILIKS